MQEKRWIARAARLDFFEKGGSQLRLITVTKTEQNQSCIGSLGSTENKIKRGVVTYDMGTRL